MKGPGPEPLSISVEDPATAESQALQAAMWAELGALYRKNTGPMGWAPAELAGPGSAFVVAWRGGRAIACGAVVPLEGQTAELRRMYVLPGERRRGVARQVLDALEALALGLGYAELAPETGIRQPAALSLYAAAGFAPVPCWGRYADDPESRCLRKRLA